jgi:hypothetical protein
MFSKATNSNTSIESKKEVEAKPDVKKCKDEDYFEYIVGSFS